VLRIFNLETASLLQVAPVHLNYRSGSSQSLSAVFYSIVSTPSWGRLGFDGDTEPYGACRVVGPVKSWHLHIIANDDVELAYAA